MKILLIVFAHHEVLIFDQFLSKLHGAMVNLPYHNCDIVVVDDYEKRCRIDKMAKRNGYQITININIDGKYQLNFINSKIKRIPFVVKERLEVFKKFCVE